LRHGIPHGFPPVRNAHILSASSPDPVLNVVQNLLRIFPARVVGSQYRKIRQMSRRLSHLRPPELRPVAAAPEQYNKTPRLKPAQHFQKIF